MGWEVVNMPYDNQSELFVCVDESDHELGSITRREAHSGSQKIHRAVTIIVLNNDKTEMLFQKRSVTKDLNPGVWACGVGGHVTYGNTYEETAKRELREELGINNTQIRFLGKYIFNMDREREYMPVYETSISKDFALTLDPTEVSEIKWCKLDKIDYFLASHPMSDATREALINTGYSTPGI